MRISENQIRKEQKIKEDFYKLKQLNKFTTSYIFNQLHQKYFLSPRTIEDICFGVYDRRRERALSA